MRALLAPLFSARRMAGLTDHIRELTDALLDALLSARDRRADLHEALSVPLPVLVICELLGVPYADRERFREWTTRLGDAADLAAAGAAFDALHSYVCGLVRERRRRPTADALSELTTTAGDLDDEEITTYGAMLLFAGHETTVARIDTGTLLLVSDRDQWTRLVDRPELVDRAVEEILRLGGSGGGPGLPRYAREDIPIAGVTIRRGDAVLLDVSAANVDPATFADPHRFDVDRAEDPHLAFGHGLRFCVGASLARIELRTVFGQLVRRLPTLHLEVPAHRLHVRRESLTGGLAELPVMW